MRDRMLKQSRRQRLGVSAVAPRHKRFVSVFLSECFRYVLHMLLMFRVKHESRFFFWHFIFQRSEVPNSFSKVSSCVHPPGTLLKSMTCMTTLEFHGSFHSVQKPHFQSTMTPLKVGMSLEEGRDDFVTWMFGGVRVSCIDCTLHPPIASRVTSVSTTLSNLHLSFYHARFTCLCLQPLSH